MSNNYYSSVLRIGPILNNDDNDATNNDHTNTNVATNNAATLLRDAILEHFRKSDSNITNNNSNSSNTLSISNRYFDANVILLGLDDETYYYNVDDEDYLKTHHYQEDGVILIFNDDYDTADRSTNYSQFSDDTTTTTKATTTAITVFDDLDRIHSNIVTPRKISSGNNKEQDADISSLVEGVGDLLRLCIGITTTIHSTMNKKTIYEDEYSRRILWCLDRGYEYVRVDLSRNENDWKTIGFHERDKDGYARVIEAIETCMWSSRVMKKTTTIHHTNNNNMVEVDMGKEEVVVVESEKETDAARQAKASAATVRNDAEQETDAVASSMNGIHPESDDATLINSHNGDGNNNLQNQQLYHQQEQAPSSSPSNRRSEELAFHQLEQLLSEAKSIREASTSNSLSDEERREKAGSTAMKLMELLGHLGLDDDDHDNDDEEEEEEA